MNVGQYLWSTVGVMAILVVTLSVGCASTSNGGGAETTRQGGEVVGQPPSEDSEDYQFAMPEAGPTEEDRAPSAPADGEEGQISRASVAQLYDYGPPVVFNHVETMPHHVDDEFVGFEIVALSAQAQQYTGSDLAVGDVVTHVNLVRLERPDDYMEAWKTLEDAEEIRIDLLRQGEEEVILWPVE